MYRSVKDSGWFDVEPTKTLLIGPNEAGKTVLLRALEHLCPGPLVPPFEPLRDFPRSEYHRIQSGELEPKDIEVVEAEFILEEDDREAVRAIAPNFDSCLYRLSVALDNTHRHRLLDAPVPSTVGSQTDALRRLAAHVDRRVPPAARDGGQPPSPSVELNAILNPWTNDQLIRVPESEKLGDWIDRCVAPYIDESNGAEMARLEEVRREVRKAAAEGQVLDELMGRLPIFVYFSTYTRVIPILHLGHLADCIDAGAIDEDDDYNFGNLCLMNLLHFSARQLSNLGNAPEPPAGDRTAFNRYRAMLDERDAILNAASLRLTQQISEVWRPLHGRGNEEPSQYTVRISVDRQYLKVEIEDSLGVSIALDQRSGGFQWLISFFIVFFAQTAEGRRDAILLLDEPGLNLHGLKQREFRDTLSRLAESNQLIFTTHSPFLVGPDELDLVRVVEFLDKSTGTRVHTEVMAEDPAALLPLQEALAYDMVQSMFAQPRNLILERLTDLWYLEATAALLRAAKIVELREDVALVPAGGTGRVAYFATILHASDLKVAALLDSDAAGERAAMQDTLVHTLGNSRILRTKDVYSGSVPTPDIEELLRETLLVVAKSELKWDIPPKAAAQTSRSILEIFGEALGTSFSRYNLAKAYVRWTRDQLSAVLSAGETEQWKGLIERINEALR
jgi:predicted ATP-dependent endonuclease of OLD family